MCSFFPVYSCALSLLDVPDRHPECMWALSLDPSHIQFMCTWFGAYPTPTLRWGEDHGDQGDVWKGRIFASEVADNLSVMLNRSVLYDGQTLRCMAQHMALAPGNKKSCSFNLSKHVVVKRASQQSWDESFTVCGLQFRGQC